MRRRLIRAAIILAAALGLGAAAKPETEGDAGKRAFDALEKLYAGPQEQPAVEDQALADLKNDSAEVRATAGQFLLALLKQSQADESNGRAPWKSLPWFGGGSECAAREFRKQLAQKIAAGPASAEIMDAALWLVQSDRLAENAQSGVKALVRIDSPRIADAYQKLLSPAFPVTAVAVSVIEDVGKRKLAAMAPAIADLCQDPRAAIRTEARKTAELLGIRNVAPFDPEAALAPGTFVEGELRKIAGMVLSPPAAETKWGTFDETRKATSFFGEPGDEPPPDQHYKVKAWLLSEDKDAYHALNLFGEELTLSKAQTKWTEAALADAAKELLAARLPGSEDAAHGETPLSREGGLTGQFEPHFVSVPEALAAAWLAQRGDRKAAAAIILPRFDAAADERWIGQAVADMLATVYQDEMLRAFTYDRDYAEAARIAGHLAKPQFEKWEYYERTRELAAQLRKRGEDFKTLVLPAPDEWKAMQGKSSRAEQVEFLAKRLRLLNAFQMGQPGGVYFEETQTREKRGGSAVDVVNPLTELEAMKLEVKDLPALLPFVDDDNFMLAYGYWRDFHPTRYMYRVRGFAAEMIDDAACRQLIDLRAYDAADAEGRHQMRDAALQWMNANSGKTRETLLLDMLEKEPDFRHVKSAASELAEKKVAAAVPLMLKRMKDFPGEEERGLLAECSALAAPEACLAPAREWVKEKGLVGFWGAMVLFRAGDKAKHEGLAELKDALAHDGKDLVFYKKSCDILLADGSMEAADLAASVLGRVNKDVNDWDMKAFVQRLLLAGRQDAVEFVSSMLDDATPDGKRTATVDGKKLQFDVVKGDRAAEWVDELRSDGVRYAWDASAEQRKTQRDQIKKWLTDQAALIRARKPSGLNKVSGEMNIPEWHLDAPQ